MSEWKDIPNAHTEVACSNSRSCLVLGVPNGVAFMADAARIEALVPEHHEPTESTGCGGTQTGEFFLGGQ